MDETKQIYVNTPVDLDLLEKLDVMVGENESTRAQYIRLLIKKQWEERERNMAGKKNYSNSYEKAKVKNADHKTIFPVKSKSVTT